MEAASKIRTIRSFIREVDLAGKSLLSINDLSNDQIYGLFELAIALEPWNRSAINLLEGNVMAALFFQPSTRTRMSFETAMHRLGGSVVTESTPMVSSSAAKEESLADMMKVVNHGSLHGIVGKVFPLDGVAEAHQNMDDRDFFGKLVIES